MHEKDSTDKKNAIEAERGNAEEQRLRAMESLGDGHV